MITICAILTAVQDKGDELEKEFMKLTPNVLKDPGTLTYIVHRNIDDPLIFFVYEIYTNDEALNLHISTSHFKEFRKNVALLVARREVGKYSEIK